MKTKTITKSYETACKEIACNFKYLYFREIEDEQYYAIGDDVTDTWNF
jgi:hypothetical protein